MPLDPLHQFPDLEIRDGDIAPATGPRFTPGDAILQRAVHVPAVWGSGTQVLWAEGEPFMIAGQPGVGKSTVAQQAVMRLIDVEGSPLLGQPIPPRNRVLYIAADRWQQILRSLRRMVAPADRDKLRDRLAFFEALPYEAHEQDCGVRTLALMEREGFDTLVIDSVYNVLPSLKDTDVKPLVDLCKTLVAKGIEVLQVHHLRKATAENRRPSTLADVEGAGALGKAAGSVLILLGDPGDELVEGVHVKQPAEPVGPIDIRHDHQAGRTEGRARPTVPEFLRESPGRLEQIASACFGSGAKALVRAQAKVDRLVERGDVDEWNGIYSWTGSA